jgi:hypothetical protein
MTANREFLSFFKKTLLLTLIVFGTLFLINYFYIRTNWYRQHFSGFTEIAKFKTLPDQLKIVNLGSSYSMFALDYHRFIGNQGFNLALNSQTFTYDYALLRKYQQHFQPGCIVLICVSYQSFTRAPHQDQTGKKYYLFLEPNYIDGFSMSKWIMYKLFPVISARDNLRYLLHDRQSVAEPLTENHNKFGITFGKKAVQAGKNINHTIRQYRQALNFNLTELRKIIMFCRQHRLTPVLFTTPFPEAVNRQLESNLLQRYFYGPIRTLENDNLLYLDYSHDPRFTQAPQLYYDAVHLNQNGRRRFTTIILQDLQDHGFKISR